MGVAWSRLQLALSLFVPHPHSTPSPTARLRYDRSQAHTLRGRKLSASAPFLASRSVWWSAQSAESRLASYSSIRQGILEILVRAGSTRVVVVQPTRPVRSHCPARRSPMALRYADPSRCPLFSCRRRRRRRKPRDMSMNVTGWCDCGAGRGCRLWCPSCCQTRQQG